MSILIFTSCFPFKKNSLQVNFRMLPPLGADHLKFAPFGKAASNTSDLTIVCIIGQNNNLLQMRKKTIPRGKKIKIKTLNLAKRGY